MSVIDSTESLSTGSDPLRVPSTDASPLLSPQDTGGPSQKTPTLYRNGPLRNQPKRVHFSSKIKVLLVGNPPNDGTDVPYVASSDATLRFIKQLPPEVDLWKRRSDPPPPGARSVSGPPPATPHSTSGSSSVAPSSPSHHRATSTVEALARVGKITAPIASTAEQTYYFVNPKDEGTGGGPEGTAGGTVSGGGTSYWGNEIFSLGCTKVCKPGSSHQKQQEEVNEKNEKGKTGIKSALRSQGTTSADQVERLVQGLNFQEDVKPILEAAAFECSLHWAPGHYNALRLLTQTLVHSNIVQVKLNSTKKYCTDWDALLQPLMILALRGLLPEDWDEFAVVDESVHRGGGGGGGKMHRPPPLTEKERQFKNSYVYTNSASQEPEVLLPLGWYADRGDDPVADLDKPIRQKLRQNRKYRGELPLKLLHLLDYSPLSSRQHYMRIDEMAWTCLGILLRDVSAAPFTSLFAIFTETVLLFLDRNPTAEIPPSFRYSTAGAAGLCSTVFYGCVRHTRKLYTIIRAMQIVIRSLDSISIDMSNLGGARGGEYQDMVESIQYLRNSESLEDECEEGAEGAEFNTGENSELPTDSPSVYLTTFIYLCAFLEDKTGTEHYVRQGQQQKLLLYSRGTERVESNLRHHHYDDPVMGVNTTTANAALPSLIADPVKPQGQHRNSQEKDAVKKSRMRPPTAGNSNGWEGAWRDDTGGADEWYADEGGEEEDEEPPADWEFGPTLETRSDYGSVRQHQQHHRRMGSAASSSATSFHPQSPVAPNVGVQNSDTAGNTNQQVTSSGRGQPITPLTDGLGGTNNRHAVYHREAEDALGESINTVKRALQSENRTSADLKRGASLWRNSGPARYLNYVHVADANLGFLFLSSMTSCAWNPKLFFAYGGRPSPAETAAAKTIWRGQMGACLELSVSQVKDLVVRWGTLPIELDSM